MGRAHGHGHCVGNKSVNVNSLRGTAAPPRGNGNEAKGPSNKG